jgi:hypothetical protein
MGTNYDPLDVEDVGYPKSTQVRKGKKDPTPKLKLTPAVLLQAVLQHHKGRAKYTGPAFMALEVGVGEKDDRRRIDGLLVSYYSQPVAYEVKVSRADWLSEMRKPDKQDAAMKLAGMVYIVAPPDVVQVDEVPTGIGLIEVKPYTSKVRVAKRATRQHNGAIPDWHQVAQIAAGILRAADAGVV